MGKLLISLGVVLILAGTCVWAVEHTLSAGWRLPGDFQFRGRNWRVSVPLATSLLVSLLLTGLANLLIMLARRR